MKVNIDIILNEVCRYYDLTPKQLFSIDRKRVIVRPRQIFYYLCTEHSRRSMDSIGEYGGRFSTRIQDHATVWHAKKLIKKEITPTKGFSGYLDTMQQIDELTERIEYNHTHNNGVLDSEEVFKYYSFLENLNVEFEIV